MTFKSSIYALNMIVICTLVIACGPGGFDGSMQHGALDPTHQGRLQNPQQTRQEVEAELQQVQEQRRQVEAEIRQEEDSNTNPSGDTSNTSPTWGEQIMDVIGSWFGEGDEEEENIDEEEYYDDEDYYEEEGGNGFLPTQINYYTNLLHNHRQNKINERIELQAEVARERYIKDQEILRQRQAESVDRERYAQLAHQIRLQKENEQQLASDLQEWTDLSFEEREQKRSSQNSIVDKYKLDEISASFRDIINRIERDDSNQRRDIEMNKNFEEWVQLSYEERKNKRANGQDIREQYSWAQLDSNLRQIIKGLERDDSETRQKIELNNAFSQWSRFSFEERERRRHSNRGIIDQHNLYDFDSTFREQILRIESNDRAERRERNQATGQTERDEQATERDREVARNLLARARRATREKLQATETALEEAQRANDATQSNQRATQRDRREATQRLREAEDAKNAAQRANDAAERDRRAARDEQSRAEYTARERLQEAETALAEAQKANDIVQNSQRASQRDRQEITRRLQEAQEAKNVAERQLRTAEENAQASRNQNADRRRARQRIQQQEQSTTQPVRTRAELEDQRDALIVQEALLRRTLDALKTNDLQTYQKVDIKLYPIAYPLDPVYPFTSNLYGDIDLQVQMVFRTEGATLEIYNPESPNDITSVLARSVKELMIDIACPENLGCPGNKVRYRVRNSNSWEEYPLANLIDYNSTGKLYKIKITPSGQRQSCVYATEVNWTGVTFKRIRNANGRTVALEYKNKKPVRGKYRGIFHIGVTRRKQTSSERNGRSKHAQWAVMNNHPLEWSLINELPLEAYLLSVVPSESIISMANRDALVAQAIAARTYSLQKILEDRRSRAYGWDLDPTTWFQSYKGCTTEHEKTDNAVTTSAGLVIADRDNRLGTTEYHACVPEKTNSGNGHNDILGERNIPDYVTCSRYYTSSGRFIGGHGRGLSQIAMYELARNGWNTALSNNIPSEDAIKPEEVEKEWTYQDILLYFYHDILLKKYDTLSI